MKKSTDKIETLELTDFIKDITRLLSSTDKYYLQTAKNKLSELKGKVWKAPELGGVDIPCETLSAMEDLLWVAEEGVTENN